MPYLSRFALAGLATGLLLSACRSSFEEECSPGTLTCECLPSGGCDDGLICNSDEICVSEGGETGESTMSTDADGSGTQGSSSGDGDGDSGDGDSGDGDSGDGDSGDGDSGDGDSTTGGGQFCGEDTPVLTFGPKATITSNSAYMPYFIAIGDVVGDNAPEIVTGGSDFTSSDDSGMVEVWVQNSAKDGLEPTSVFEWDALDLPDPTNGGPDSKEFASLVIHDLNQDFDPDLVILSRTALHSFMHGDSTLTPNQDLEVGYRLSSPVVGPWVGGGVEDIFFSHSPVAAEGSYVEVQNDGTMALLNPVPNTPLSSLMGAGAAADLNGDDEVDIVLAETRNEGALGDEVFSVLLRDSPQGDATFATTDYDPQDGSPAELELIDIDGDTDIDIVLTTAGSDMFNPFDDPETWPGVNTNESIQLFENQGDGTFVHLESIPIGDRVAGLAAADFNCDGETDLVASTYHGEIFFLAGQSEGGFGPPEMIFDEGPWVGPLEAADLDNDGRPDLVWSSVIDREIVVAYQQ